VRVIGLTGGIGSGKSTVSAGLARRGAVVVDADAITRQLQEPGQAVFEQMVAHFGTGILAPDGTLDRQAVADQVFSDPEQRRALETIVHPEVGRVIGERLADLAGTDNLVVLDIPLLVEVGRDGLDAIVVVDLDPEVAVRRLVDHRNVGEADARARMATQASREDRLARADFVIDNGGDLAHLETELDRCWAWLTDQPGGATALEDPEANTAN